MCFPTLGVGCFGSFDFLIKKLCHAFNVLVLVGQKAFENVGPIFLNKIVSKSCSSLLEMFSIKPRCM